MNILVIHCASTKLIEKVLIQTSADQKYVLTFSKNKGTFNHLASEIYFNKQTVRIYPFTCRYEVQKIIDTYNINKVVAVYNNESGNGYSNIRILMMNIRCPEKLILDSNLSEIAIKVRKYDRIIERYYQIINSGELYKFTTRLRAKKEKTNVSSGEIKKILLVNTSCTVGGVENLLLKWGNQLAQEYQVNCALYRTGGMLKQYLSSNMTVHIESLEQDQEYCPVKFYIFLKHLCQNEKPDLIITAGMETMVPAILAGVYAENPLIIKMVNGVSPRIADCKEVGYELNSWLPMLNLIIAVSKSVKADLVENHGVPESSIQVIFGSTVSAIENITLRRTAPLKNKRILCASRLSPEKGLDVLIRAVALVPKEILQCVRIIIAGDGGEKSKLIKLVHHFKLEKHIKFLGFHDNISQLINESYCTVLSSHTEGLPLFVLESMAHGRICIASNVGGTPEIINNRKNGFLFEDNNHYELAQLLVYCLTNSQEVFRMEDMALKTIQN